MPLYATSKVWLLMFWASYICWVIFEMWVFRRDRQAVRGEARDRGSLYSVIICMVIGLAIGFSAPHVARFARMHLPAIWIFWSAMALIWAGLGTRLWAIVTLGRFFRTTVFMQETHRLVTDGPYRILRHPAYTGSLMTLAGIGLAMGNWISLAGIVGCALVGYIHRIGAEERALREHFGKAFEENRTRTWAILPFVW